MHIAVSLSDQSFEHTQSLGILNASLGLTRALARSPRVQRLTVASNRELGACVGPARVGLSYRGLEHVAPRRAARVFWDQWRVADVGSGDDDADWLLLPKGFPPLLRWPARRVCAYLHDDIVLEQPGRSRTLRTSLERAYFGAMLHRALRRCDLIVSNSAFTSERLRQLQPELTTPLPKIVTIGVGFDARPKTPGTRSHLLVLTSRHAHKLTARAIEWLLRWDETNTERHPIVGVGDLPRDISWPARAHWRHVSRPSDETYRAWLTHASALVYFSAYEGCGMPPREALQQGIWTLASNLPAIREDVPASCLFDNDSFLDFSVKLTTVIAHARAGTSSPSIALSDWDTVTERMLDAMQASPSCSLERRHD